MVTTVPPSDEALAAAAERLGRALRERHWRLATAESCTGGLVGHAITGISGSSDYYVGGVICYWDRAKEVELSVPHELLAEHGAVSAQVAAAMADGARKRFGVEIGVAVTGVAGPQGGSPDKPVGLVYVAAARRGHPPVVERQVWPFDRDGNKRASTLRVLEVALAEVEAAA
ncbi:MAG TPA: CinA family protein [Candidatus Limnocylindria bacterium]|nr:CinA family protein [Candidatus Limnocylindria bacterium]